MRLEETTSQAGASEKAPFVANSPNLSSHLDRLWLSFAFSRLSRETIVGCCVRNIREKQEACMFAEHVRRVTHRVYISS